MNYLIVKDGIIVNIIVCDDDRIAEKFGAVPSYDGANIGSAYDPPPPPEPEPTTEEILLEIAADHEARLCEIELGV